MNLAASLHRGGGTWGRGRCLLSPESRSCWSPLPEVASLTALSPSGLRALTMPHEGLWGCPCQPPQELGMGLGVSFGRGKAPPPLSPRCCGGPALPLSRALPKSLRTKPKAPEAAASPLPRDSEEPRAPPPWAGIRPPSPSEASRTPSRPRSTERAEVSRARGSREVPG